MLRVGVGGVAQPAKAVVRMMVEKVATQMVVARQERAVVRVEALALAMWEPTPPWEEPRLLVVLGMGALVVQEGQPLWTVSMGIMEAVVQNWEAVQGLGAAVVRLPVMRLLAL